MSSLLVILLSAVLVCYYAPAMLGTRIFEDADDFHSMSGMALASALLLVVIAPVSYELRAILQYFDVSYLHALATILVIMTFVQILTRVMPSWGWTPVRPAFPLLMSTHCAVFGVALLAAEVGSIVDALWMGFGMSLAFVVLLASFQLLHRRMLQANVPVIFRDVPLALVSAGLMVLALMGLTGLVRD
ncbi:MAG: Rnf-Nqr domain containing protein [Povalibacter sp.]